MATLQTFKRTKLKEGRKKLQIKPKKQNDRLLKLRRREKLPRRKFSSWK